MTSGEPACHEVELEEDVTSHIDVVPEDPRTDPDLSPVDGNGNVVDQDLTADHDARCTVTPAWTGPLQTVVTSQLRDTQFDIRVTR